MGYLLLFLATLLWSFVGILVKSASTMADSTVITYARFGFGIVFHNEERKNSSVTR